MRFFGGVVEDLGIDEGEFGSADAVGFHLLEFAEDFRLFDGGAEPPPADHGPGARRRIEKALPESRNTGCRRSSGDRSRLKCGTSDESAKVTRATKVVEIFMQES